MKLKGIENSLESGNCSNRIYRVIYTANYERSVLLPRPTSYVFVCDYLRPLLGYMYISVLLTNELLYYVCYRSIDLSRVQIYTKRLLAILLMDITDYIYPIMFKRALLIVWIHSVQPITNAFSRERMQTLYHSQVVSEPAKLFGKC